MVYSATWLAPSIIKQKILTSTKLLLEWWTEKPTHHERISYCPWECHTHSLINIHYLPSSLCHTYTGATIFGIHPWIITNNLVIYSTTKERLQNVAPVQIGYIYFFTTNGFYQQQRWSELCENRERLKLCLDELQLFQKQLLESFLKATRRKLIYFQYQVQLLEFL